MKSMLKMPASKLNELLSPSRYLCHAFMSGQEAYGAEWKILAGSTQSTPKLWKFKYGRRNLYDGRGFILWEENYCGRCLEQERLLLV